MKARILLLNRSDEPTGATIFCSCGAQLLRFMQRFDAQDVAYTVEVLS